MPHNVHLNMRRLIKGSDLLDATKEEVRLQTSHDKRAGIS